MKRPILLFFMMAWCFSLLAQERKMERLLAYQHYGVREGLAQSQVFQVLEDTWGYLWFATYDGVSRFDGKTFTNYKGENNVTVSGRARHIGQYKDILFFISLRGITLLNPDGRIEHYPLPGNFRTVNPDAPVQKDNLFYLFNCDDESHLPDRKSYYYFVFDFESRQLTQSLYKVPYATYAQNTPKGIMVMNKHNGVEGGQVLLIGENDYSVVQNLPDAFYLWKEMGRQCFFTSVKTKTEGKYGVFKYTFDKDTFRRALFSTSDNILNHYYHPAYMGDGYYYQYMETTNASYIIKDGKSEKLPIETTIVNHAMTDRNGNLWLCTEDGVYNLFDRQFESYRPGLSRNDNIWDMKKDVFGNVWFNMYGQGLWRADKEGKLRQADYFVNGKRDKLKLGYMGGCVDSIGRIYFTYSDGVAIFDPRKGNTTHVDGIKNGVPLIAYYDTLTNKVFMSGIITGDTYLSSLDEKLNKTDYYQSGGYVVSICRDGNGRLRYGTYREEGYVDEENIRLVADTTSRPYASLISMATDSSGTLWKGTDMGVFAEDRAGVNRRIFPEKVQLVGNYRNRYLIFGPLASVFYVLDLKRYYAEDTVVLRSFNQYQGVDIIECGQNGYWEDRDGYVWIVGGDKVIRFQPDSLMATPPPTAGSPFIASVSHSEKLESGDNFLTYEILQAYTYDPDKLQFRYRLLPYSADWTGSTNRTINFQNLPHGNYRLEVQSTVDGTNWSDSAFSSAITISKPFWFTVPGLLILFLLFSGILLAVALLVRRQVVRNQTKKREIDQLKYRAVRSKYIPHFTGNVLNSINYLIEKDRKLAQKYIIEFSHFSGQTLLNAEKVYRPLQDELDYARAYLELEKLRFEDKLEYGIEVDAKALTKLPIPAMVLQTFCENALKHGLRHKQGTGTVRIKVSVAGDYHLISVEDNGIGRERAKTMKTEGTGEGLAIVDQQLSLFNNSGSKRAFMEIVDLHDPSGNPAGTRFEIHIPTDFIHSPIIDSYV